MTGEEIAGPGLRTFFRICEKWQLAPRHQHLILGSPDMEALESWRGGQYDNVPGDVIIRISYVLGIYEALHAIFHDSRNADGWVTSPNDAPLFAGRRAIDVMIDEGVGGLASVRKYLDAQAAGWS